MTHFWAELANRARVAAYVVAGVPFEVEGEEASEDDDSEWITFTPDGGTAEDEEQPEAVAVTEDQWAYVTQPLYLYIRMARTGEIFELPLSEGSQFVATAHRLQANPGEIVRCDPFTPEDETDV